MSQAVQQASPLPERLWRYQAERFPLFKHGLLILVFAYAGVAYAGSLTTGAGWSESLAAFGIVFLLFAQLRVADEHKDHADDLRFRPERPVPSGLVTLRELRRVAALAAAAQIGLALTVDLRIVGWLLVVWAGMGLMTVEFFAPAQLKARPVLYLVSHMAVMPLIALLAVACGAAGLPLRVEGLAAFLALSFFNGVALEVGRKTWGPEDERAGVETYSKLWGSGRAAVVFAASVSAVALAAGVAIGSLLLGWGDTAPANGNVGWLVLAPAAVALAPLVAAAAYARSPSARAAKRLETTAGVFTLASYLLVAGGTFFR
jgi:4-hydroxybenzoate polyprenyltransferase